VAERDALLSFHSDLNGRLREIVTSIVNYSNDDEIHELATIGGIISPELAPSRSARRRAEALAAEAPDAEAPEAPVADDDDDDEDAPVVATDVTDEADGADDAGETEGVIGADTDDEGTNGYRDFEDAEMLADESFDRAFTSFMGNDSAAEPSRDWMINGE
jgi:hypothetical protein